MLDRLIYMVTGAVAAGAFFVAGVVWIASAPDANGMTAGVRVLVVSALPFVFGLGAVGGMSVHEAIKEAGYGA